MRTKSSRKSYRMVVEFVYDGYGRKPTPRALRDLVMVALHKERLPNKVRWTPQKHGGVRLTTNHNVTMKVSVRP
jgi:hypothetical protein